MVAFGDGGDCYKSKISNWGLKVELKGKIVNEKENLAEGWKKKKE